MVIQWHYQLLIQQALSYDRHIYTSFSFPSASTAAGSTSAASRPCRGVRCLYIVIPVSALPLPRAH